MRCEDVLLLLPDDALGTLDEADRREVRVHLRGCAACRAEAARLDEGLTSFASSLESQPPPELEERIMAVLHEEWEEPGAAAGGGRRGWVRWLSVAAIVLALAVAVAWGSVSQVRAGRLSEDAAAYHSFLTTLGGKDVRVGRLVPVNGSSVEGSAVLYDGEWERSWALVLIKAPGYTGELTPTLTSPTGHPIEMFPAKVEADGEGSSWLVSSGDLSGYHTLTVRDGSGAMVARATLGPSD
jgi:Putative zinc-finger